MSLGCEFCWSVRTLFAAAGIAYRSVDLDWPEYRDTAWVAEDRAARATRPGATTIPQVFVGGRHVGGATETFDAYRDGRLAEMIDGLRLPAVAGGLAPTASCPGLHPR